MQHHHMYFKELPIMMKRSCYSDQQFINRTVSRIQNRHRLSNLTSLHVIKISEEYKVTRYGDFYAWFQCSKITQNRITVIQLKTISDISVPVYIIQWWHLQDDPNRVHSVICCVWSSTGFFYVVELCTNNEKVRRHLQICIVESTCVCTEINLNIVR